MLINKINSKNSQTDMDDCRGLYKAMAEIWTFTELFEYLKVVIFCLN